MPRSSNQKLKLLFIRDYLMENTDENHPASTADIIAHLDANGVSAERKSIYNDIEALREYGMEIEKLRSGNDSGWYVADREFELAHLRLLVDIVQSSRSISEKKSTELINKISALANAHDRKSLKRHVWVKGRTKSNNEELFYAVDHIHAALNENRQIRFHYYKYDVTKKRQLRHGGNWYQVSPLALLCDNGNYYLVAYNPDNGEARHYRVDKMMNTEVLDEPRERRALDMRINCAEYASSHFGMFGGESGSIRLEFANELADVVQDYLGSDLQLTPLENNWFSVTVKEVMSEPFRGWLCGFGDKVRVVGPESAVQSMKEHVCKVAAMYKD